MAQVTDSGWQMSFSNPGNCLPTNYKEKLSHDYQLPEYT